MLGNFFERLQAAYVTFRDYETVEARFERMQRAHFEAAMKHATEFETILYTKSDLVQEAVEEFVKILEARNPTSAEIGKFTDDLMRTHFTYDEQLAAIQYFGRAFPKLAGYKAIQEWVEPFSPALEAARDRAAA